MSNISKNGFQSCVNLDRRIIDKNVENILLIKIIRVEMEQNAWQRVQMRNFLLDFMPYRGSNKTMIIPWADQTNSDQLARVSAQSFLWTA